MDEAAKSACCRANGVYPQELLAWRQSAVQALTKPEEAQASPHQTRQDRRRIQELERELRSEPCFDARLFSQARMHGHQVVVLETTPHCLVALH